MESKLQLAFDASREQLKNMADLVERALGRSIQALKEFDPVIANYVIEDDKAINSFEIDIEKATFNILAFYTDCLPAEILRQVLAIQRITTMLERIGDHAVNISESAETLSRISKGCPLFEILEMADQCKKVLHESLRSFLEQDVLVADTVLMMDDEIDRLNVCITAEIKANVFHGDDSTTFETALELIRVCKNLERIADLGTNIAEEAEFAIRGRIVKHHLAESVDFAH